MPNCPNCGTWNPDDKDVCWRCQSRMPKTEEKVKRTPRRIGGFPLWFWLALVVFLAVSFLGQCFLPAPGL